MRILAVGLCLVMSGMMSGVMADQGRGTGPTARTCSAYRASCDAKNAAECEARLQACLKSGCWVDAAQRAGKAHCGLERK